MQTATSEFKECMNNGYPEYGTARITLTDGTIIDVEKDDFLMDSNGFSINRSCSSTNRFEIGTVVSSCLTMKLLNFDGRYNLYDFNKAKVTKASIGMELPSGKTEIIPQGNFIVDAQDFNGGIVTLTCYDNLAEWDVNYTGNKNGTAINLIVAMATKHKVVLSNNNFNNCNYEVNIADDVKCTDRQMLSYILSITGNNANIDRNGYLKIWWYSAENNSITLLNAKTVKAPSENQVDAGDIINITNVNKMYVGYDTYTKIPNKLDIVSLSSVDVADVIITGVKIAINETEYIAGNKEYAINISNNPLVNKNNAQEIANNVWSVIQGTSFRAMTFSVLSNPLLELGDKVVIELEDGVYETYLTNIQFAVGYDTKIIIGAESPRKNSSNSSNAYTTEIARQQANEKITAYDALNKQLINLITMSMGLYEIREKQNDGSEIIYLTNKPTLEESIGGTVWRIALDVFTITNDYQGKNTEWKAGFDSQGNLLVNVLSAIGISADWIQTGEMSANRIYGGTLTLGGLGDSNGNLYLYDSQRRLIAKMDSTGVLLDGATIKINGNNFTLKSDNTTIQEDGTIICKNAQLENVSATGSFTCENDTTNAIHMVGTFIGGELKIAASDSSYAFLQGHLLEIYDGTNANLAQIGRNGILFQDRQTTSRAWMGISNSSSGYRGAFLQLRDEGGENLVNINTADWIMSYGRPASDDSGTGWRYFDTTFYINRPTGYRFVITSDKHGAYYPDWDITLYGAVLVQYSMHVKGGISQSSAATTDSDRNVKKDIKLLNTSNSAKFIYSLKPCEFKYIEGTSDRFHHGLIAQDVKESMGDDDWGLFIDKSVSKEKYIDKIAYASGKTEETITAKYGLRYEELIADLIATVQSQNERITTLENEMSKLKEVAYGN